MLPTSSTGAATRAPSALCVQTVVPTRTSVTRTAPAGVAIIVVAARQIGQLGAPVSVRDAMLTAPSTLTVPAGTTVTWVNHDAEIHTVTSPAGAFASPALETDDTFSFTFNAPGTYDYFCALHPHMKSTVVVK